MKNTAFDKPTSSRAYILQPEVKKIVGTLKNKKLLDVGCGNGYWTRFFEKLGASCTGIDTQKLQIDAAKKQPGTSSYTVASADTFNSTGKFDVIFLDHILSETKSEKQILKILKNMKRLLGPNGVIILNEMHPSVAHFLAGTKTERDYFYFKSPSKFIFTVKRADGSYVEVTDYHWTIADFSSFISKCGFVIETIVEPRYKSKSSDTYLHKRSEYPTHILFKLRRSN